MIAASTPRRSTGSHRDLGGDFGPLAHLEKIVLRAHAAVLGHVTPRLAHQPHRRVRRGLAPAREHHRMVAKRFAAAGGGFCFEGSLLRLHFV